jgi:hypothetical protein
MNWKPTLSDRLQTPALDKVEKHLLISELCRTKLALSDQYVWAMKKAIALAETAKRLRSIHLTEDGPIFGTIHSGADGKWIARQCGRQLDGAGRAIPWKRRMRT